MKKRLGIFMTAALAAAVLTACTRADSGNSSAGTGSSASSGSGTIEASGNSTGTASQSGSAASDTSLAGAGSDASASGTGTAAADEGDFEGGVTVENDIPGEAEVPADEENLSDEQMGALEEEDDASEEGWVGTYLNENSETLTVSAADASTITFSFSNAGISGTAALNGNQATYEGDDYHVVVFDFAGTDIKVSVLSEEDYDASSSPVNGVYIRQ